MVAATLAGRLQAMIDVVVYQRAFCVRDSLLNSLQLLRKIQTGTPLLHHRDNFLQMAIRALEALDDGWMHGVQVFHRELNVSSPGGYMQPEEAQRLAAAPVFPASGCAGKKKTDPIKGRFEFGSENRAP